jgi:hypothetical protein
MIDTIVPFNPELEIKLITKELPSFASEGNIAELISIFFTHYQRGSATEEQLFSYAKALAKKYLVSERKYLSLLQKVRDFDFSQNPALISDEVDRCIWHGRFSTLANHRLLSATELKRATSQDWWGIASRLFVEWYLSGFEDDNL